MWKQTWENSSIYNSNKKNQIFRKKFSQVGVNLYMKTIKHCQEKLKKT